MTNRSPRFPEGIVIVVAIFVSLLLYVIGGLFWTYAAERGERVASIQQPTGG